MNTVKYSILSLALLALPLAASDSIQPVAEPTLAIQAAHVLVDGGQVIDDAIVLIGEGRVLKVAPAADLRSMLPDDLHVLEHDGWLSSGLVAVNSTLGLTYRDDSTNAFMDELELIAGFNPKSKNLSAARNLGLTSFGLVAGGSNVIGGVGGIAKTDGSLVKRRASLSVCLSTSAIQGRRFPTSYGGALGALRQRIAEPKGSMAEVLGGDLYMSIDVSTRSEAARALDFAVAAKIPAVLRGAVRVGEFASELKQANMSVTLRPLGLGASAQSYASILALAKAEVPFSFGLADNGNSAGSLREGVALAVRAGLDRAVAWRSITSTAAQIMGVSDHIGRVAVGFDADIVLWSGDPLSITSRPVAIYVDGKLTEGAKR